MPLLNFCTKTVKKTSKSRKKESQGRPGAPPSRPKGFPSDPKVAQSDPKVPQGVPEAPKRPPKSTPKSTLEPTRAKIKINTFSKPGFVHRRSVFEVPKPKVDYPYYVLGTFEGPLLVKSNENIVNTMLLEPPKKSADLGSGAIPSPPPSNSPLLLTPLVLHNVHRLKSASRHPPTS